MRTLCPPWCNVDGMWTDTDRLARLPVNLQWPRYPQVDLDDGHLVFVSTVGVGEERVAASDDLLRGFVELHRPVVADDAIKQFAQTWGPLGTEGLNLLRGRPAPPSPVDLASYARSGLVAYTVEEVATWREWSETFAALVSSVSRLTTTDAGQTPTERKVLDELDRQGSGLSPAAWKKVEEDRTDDARKRLRSIRRKGASSDVGWEAQETLHTLDMQDTRRRISGLLAPLRFSLDWDEDTPPTIAVKPPGFLPVLALMATVEPPRDAESRRFRICGECGGALEPGRSKWCQQCASRGARFRHSKRTARLDPEYRQRERDRDRERKRRVRSQASG